MLNKIARQFVWLVFMGLLGAGVSQAQIIEKNELKKLIATASTAADHERIAKHYDAKAAQLEAEAKDHAELAIEYKRNPTGHEAKHPMSGQTAGHCDLFAKKFAEAAKDARQLAADHRAMAKTIK